MGWVKVLHIAGLAIWIGTLFTAARLAIASGQEKDAVRTALLGQAVRTDRIANVGATITVLTGLTLFFVFLPFAHYMKQGWMHSKLLFVIVLLVLQLLQTLKLSKGKKAGALESTGFFKLVSSLGGVAVLVVIAMVVLKPWASLG